MGDFEKATAIYDKYKARQMAKSYETLVKDLEEGVEGKAEFLEAVKRRDWQQAVNIAENTMDLTPRDLIKSVKSKRPLFLRPQPTENTNLPRKIATKTSPLIN